MKWIGITGSWRQTSAELQRDVEAEVTRVLKQGNGIVTGGALGVDFLATKIALDFAPDGSRLKVFLPTNLEIYAAHYQKRAEEAVITSEQAESLIRQLEAVIAVGALKVNSDETEVNERTYYLRNTDVMNASDELIGFQVNKSEGTQDTINKARAKGIPVNVRTYTIS